MVSYGDMVTEMLREEGITPQRIPDNMRVESRATTAHHFVPMQLRCVVCGLKPLSR